MKLFVPFCLLFSVCFASEIDTMRQALRQYVSEEGVEILLAQAKLESHYGTKGVSKKVGGFNWWNISAPRYAKNKRVAYEYERGRRVKKYWYYWDTPETAAKGLTKYLKRKYPNGWKNLNRGDIDGYARCLKIGRYFTGSAKGYAGAIKRRIKGGKYE